MRRDSLIKQVKELAEPDYDPDEYAVNKLIVVNNMAIDSILQELQNGQKKHHYMWWICPTEKPGYNDPLKTHVTKKTYAKFLANIDLDKWLKVLSIIAEPRSIISDSDDIGRIGFFCKFWGSVSLKHWPELTNVIKKLERKYS